MNERDKSGRANTVVFVGNCQAHALGHLYREFFAGERGESVAILADVDLVGRTPDDVAAGLDLIAAASVVVEQVLDWTPPFRDAVAGAERVIRFPLVAGSFLWPFSGNAHPRNATYEFPGFDGPYPDEYGDGFLNRKIRDNASPSQAVDEYVALDAARAGNVARRFEILIEKQRSRDAETGFSLATVITNQLATEPLFISRGHPTMRLFAPMAAGVLERMGIGAGDIARAIAALDGPPFPREAVPIHPSVATHFGLSYVTPATRYPFLGGRYTFAAFADHYMRLDRHDLLLAVMPRANPLPDLELLDLLERGLAEEPDSAPGLCLRAETLHRLGRVDAAIASAEAATVAPDAGVRPFILLSRLLRANGSPSAAAVTARQALAVHPFHAAAHAALAEALLDDRGAEPGAAAAAATRAHAFAPSNAHYASLLQMALERDGVRAGPMSAPKIIGPRSEVADIQAHPTSRARERKVLRYDLRDSAINRGAVQLLDGWAAPETGLIWMVGQSSRLSYPIEDRLDELIVDLECWPHVNDGGLVAQRLSVAHGGRPIANAIVNSHTTLRFRVPVDPVADATAIHLEFSHPDAIAPASFPELGNPDQRLLAIAMVCLTITAILSADATPPV